MGPKVVFEPILILNEVTEFKDNPDNPIVYVKVCTHTVWFTKSRSLLPLAKKSLLFKTGAEKYSLPKLT